MNLIDHGTVPQVIAIFAFVGIGVIILGFILAIIADIYNSNLFGWSAVTVLVLGIVSAAVFGIIFGAKSASLDTAAAQNMQHEAKTAYGLVLSNGQATRLLQHHTITLNDGRKVFLAHVKGHQFELRKVGPSSPLTPVER